MSRLPPDLAALIEESARRVRAMSPEERAAMWQAQKESFVRAMNTPCEHGIRDFETCPECRAGAAVVAEELIAEAEDIAHGALRAALPVMRRALWDYMPRFAAKNDITSPEWTEIAPDLAAIRLATAIVGSQPDSAGVDTEWLDRAIAAAPEGEA